MRNVSGPPEATIRPATQNRNDDPWSLPNARRNIAVLVLDGFFFALGYNFLSPISILPVFIARLTPVDLFAGSFTALDQIAIAIPQFIGAKWADRFAQRGRRKWLKAYTNLSGRIPIAITIVTIAVLGDSHRSILVATMMVAFFLFRLAEGAGVPAYFDLIGLVIHPRLRPRYFSWQQAATAVGGIVSAFGARWVLGALPFPWNFVASFSVGLTLVVAVTGVFLQVREPPPVSDPRPTGPASALPAGTETSHRPSWHQSVVAIWRSDGGFRRLVLTRALIGIAGMAPAYYAVSAVRRLAASDMDAATFGLIALGSQLVGTLMWGEIVARSRRPWFLVGGTIIGALGALAATSATSITSVYPVFVAMGVGTSAQIMCDMSLPMQLAERAEASRGMYVASYNTVIIPFSIAAPIVGGAISAISGFDAVNGVSIVAYCLAAASGATVVRMLGSRSRPIVQETVDPKVPK